MVGAIAAETMVRGFLSEGRHWMHRVLELVDEPTPERALLLWVDGWHALNQGDVDGGEPRLEASRDLAERLGDAGNAAVATVFLGMCAMMRDDVPGAFRLYERGVRTDAAGPRSLGVRDGRHPARVRLVPPGGGGSGGGAVRGGDLREQRAWGEVAQGRGLGRSQHDRVATGRHPSGERAGCRRTTDPARVRQRGGHGAVPRDPGLDRRHGASVPQGRATSRRGRRESGTRSTPPCSPTCSATATRPRRPSGERWGRGHSRPTTESVSRAAHADNVAFALDEPEESAVRSDSGAVGVLTRREREIADLVADGLSNREIAAKLVISRRTAEGHVDHILGKLGFTSRVQIAAWVAEHRTAPIRAARRSSRSRSPRLRTSSAGRSGRRCAEGGAPASWPDVRQRRRADVRARWRHRAG